MDIILGVLYAFGILLMGIAATVYWADGGSKTVALWFLVAGVVWIIVTAGFQAQRAINESYSAHSVTESEVRQQRAYVHPSEGDVAYGTDGKPTVSASIKNTGQTPAHKLTWRAKFLLANNSKAPEFTFDPKDVGTPATVPPGGSLSYIYTFPEWKPEFDRLLQKREFFIFAIGEIRYEDAFGIQRFTDYQLISSGRFENGSGIAPGKFGPAASGNNSN